MKIILQSNFVHINSDINQTNNINIKTIINKPRSFVCNLKRKHVVHC